ncbi:M20/M25/M40 family metallo-hydrolase [Thermasporomyces composti]|jgi:glutamate carboxypeptidase|uniref:Glutamate carboxypeptidase n=1 Tax=Thermasporomyces composti TaxID=696763 RepID=A0A3D9V297_THECX|nr:M20/M25/M40 family metallo-hydrolase [Thermasporomyces composti]REF35647.1 glutamate carboxypeptidase [Thermasporomyces composti]
MTDPLPNPARLDDDLPYADLAAAAAEQLPFARERLRTYVLAESPSGDAAALAACADLILRGHREVGGRTERVPGPAGDHLVTRWGPDDGEHLMLLGHYDTVWPVGQLARMPYADDGTRISGPGTYDMKGGLVVIEAALRTLAALDIPLARQVRAVVVADEEVGSPDGGRVVREHLVGARAVLGFEPPHRRGILKTGRMGSTRVRLDVTGREAHAALDPTRGVSAIDELLDQLAAIRALVPDDGTTLLNIGRIAGGTRTNVVAGHAEAELGLRFTDLDVERAVLAKIRALAPVRQDATVSVQLLSNRPAWTAPDPNPLLDSVVAIAERLGQRLGGRPATGAGDTNFTGAAGVPTLDGFGPDGAGAHAVHESILVSSLVDRTALLAAILASPTL